MSWYEEFDAWTHDYLPNLRVLYDEPMANQTSFRIGGAARRFALPATPEELVLLHTYAVSCGAQPFVIGNGSNLLFPEKVFDRLVISTKKMSRIAQEKERLYADAGVSLARLATYACEQSLTGLEFAHGIPGSVGGAICMNAGAYGGEMKDVVDSVAVLFPDGIHYFKAEEMEFTYRSSMLSRRTEGVILYASFLLQDGNKRDIRTKMNDLMVRRKEKQPLEFPSAGSTFKRPEGNFAGALIEKAGLKGVTVGGAQVSEKHAGFVVNRGGATSDDVRQLIKQVQTRVWDVCGVMLEPEVKIID